jgi:hypothetical protein
VVTAGRIANGRAGDRSAIQPIIVIRFHVLVGVPICEIHDVPGLQVQRFTDVPLVSDGIITALAVGVITPNVLGMVSANDLSQEESGLDIFFP